MTIAAAAVRMWALPVVHHALSKRRRVSAQDRLRSIANYTYRLLDLFESYRSDIIPRRSGKRNEYQPLRKPVLIRPQHLRYRSIRHSLRQPVGSAFPTELLTAMGQAPLPYLAHEYMNANWSPCFHADVADAMADAKLDWAASANLLETFPDLLFSESQKAVFDSATDPAMQELIKDTCIPRQLRHDTYIRGARRLSNAARDAALGRLTLGLTVAATDFRFKLDVPAGEAEMGPAFRPMVAALSTGPKRVSDLLTLATGDSTAAEVAGVLIGTGQAIVVLRPGTVASPEANQLNRVLGRAVETVAVAETSGGLACSALGGGLPASRLLVFVCARLLDGGQPDDVGNWLDALRHDVPEEKVPVLRSLLEGAVEKQLPIFRQLGILTQSGTFAASTPHPG